MTSNKANTVVMRGETLARMRFANHLYTGN